MVPVSSLTGAVLLASSSLPSNSLPSNEVERAEVKWENRHLALVAQVGTLYGTGGGFEGRFFGIRAQLVVGFLVKTGQLGPGSTEGWPQSGPSPPSVLGTGTVIDSDTLGSFTLRMPGLKSEIGEAGLGISFAFHQWATSGAGISLYGDYFLSDDWKLGFSGGAMVFPDLIRATSSWEMFGTPIVGRLVFGFTAQVAYGTPF